ncbi:MAG: ELWxxDGT repeat protein, partial [Bacteroidota bacterium]
MKKITLIILGLLMAMSGTAWLQAQTLEPGVDGSLTNLTPDNVVVTTLMRAPGLRGKNIQVTSNLVFFTASDTINSGEELWVSDGTAGGTMMVKDIQAGEDGSDPKHLCAVGDTVYFSADDGTNGAELWMSDGTEAGTKMVKDIFLGGANASNPDMMVAFKGGVLFRAKDNISAADNDRSYLWWSDGSESGTNQLHPIQPVIVPDGQNLTQIQVTHNGEKAFFVGLDDEAGQELWVTWGDSTKLVLDIGFAPDTNSTIPNKTVDTDIRWLYAVNDEQLWFRPFTPAFWLNDSTLEDSIEFLDNEVWVTNGEPWGTYPLGDLNQVIDPNDPTITGNTGAAFPFNYDGKTYYRANDGIVNTELFSTDLSPGSQTLVKNIHGQNANNGNESAAFVELQVIFDGFMYFKGQTRWDDPAVGLPAYGQ